MPSATDSPQLHHRLRSLVIAIAGLALLLAVAGAIYQSLSLARDRRSYPMPGELVDVGGYKMHLDCTGAGSPAVILESGLGDTYISWHKVQPSIAQFTRVCSYDRAGLGFSEANPHANTSRDVAETLHTLLRNAGVSPPYVLVGHSLGGFHMRVFTGLYRDEVAGVVLVDSSHPEQQKRLPPAINDLLKTFLRDQEFIAAVMPFGLPRLLGFCGNDGETRAAECTFRSARTTIAEIKAIPASAAQAAASGSFNDLPLVVLSQDPDAPQPDLPEDLVKPESEAWQQMQEELTRLSTRGRHLVIKRSGHYIQLDQPGAVVEAVRQVIDQARTSR